MLNLSNINLTLGLGSPLENKVFNNLNLNIKQGEFIVIIGGNGAGKSTLMNMISGLIKPDEGEVCLDNQNIHRLSSSQKAKWIAKVAQDPKVGTIESMSIFENMAFALKRGQRRGFQLFSNKHRTHFFKEKLSQLNMGLENRLTQSVGNLSGGQRQVLSLVMATLTDSKLLLLDEMTAALDPSSSKEVMRLTNEIVRAQNRTCILITHNMSQAIEYGDRILLLKQGSFIKEYNKMDKAKLTASELALQFEN